MTKFDLSKIKTELKTEAIALSTNKRLVRQMQRESKYAGNLQWKVLKDQREWRHKHIAYCLLKGRSLNEIETTVSENNKPNEERIQKYLDYIRFECQVQGN